MTRRSPWVEPGTISDSAVIALYAYGTAVINWRGVIAESPATWISRYLSLPSKEEGLKLRRTLKTPFLSGDIVPPGSEATWVPKLAAFHRLKLTVFEVVIGFPNESVNLPWKFICWGTAAKVETERSRIKIPEKTNAFFNIKTPPEKLLVSSCQ
jgi:hypothetical protein